MEYRTTTPLKGKKIIYDGDSICEYSPERNDGAYAERIAEICGGTCVNLAVGGGTLASQKLRPLNCWGQRRHSLVDSLANLPQDGDLYCFEGGVNDYWQNIELGFFDADSYDYELDPNTVSGALELIFRYAIDEFLGKPICFVIVHKISEYSGGKRTADLMTKKNSADTPYTFDECHARLVAICKKYSIPYYDAYEESGLNGWNKLQNEHFFYNSDGCHPNGEGYKRYYVPQLISLFEKIMP